MLMQALYEEIRNGAKEMDADRIEEAFSEMEGYRIPEDDAEIFDKVRKAYLAFDYDRIEELLAEIIGS